jgi:cytosine/adenosine deaminase-related metal-dependent hydrolase
LFAHESGAKDKDYYWFTLQGALDHLVHGITSVYNFTVNKNKNEDFAIWQWRAELDSGVRFIHSFEPAEGSSLKERNANLEKFLAYVKKDMSRPTVLKLAYSGWLREPQAFKWDASLLHKNHLYSEIHFLESPVNKKMQQEAFKYVRSEKMLGADISFGHFIHVNDTILKTVSESGSGMVWNPMSNGRLASGIVDIPKYQKMGIKIGMGVDGEGSADLPDPFENMRTGLYFIRAKYENAKILQPIDVLRFHTLGSAEVLGIQDKVGSLEKGKFGDVIVIDPALVERGPVRDPYAAVVLSCNAMNISKVYVGGELLVDTYKLQKNNMKIVSREVNQRVADLEKQLVAIN